MSATNPMTAALGIMLAELESSKLEVALVPLDPRKRNYNEGGCKRVAVSKNATWYQKLCAQYPSSRGTRRGGFDTRLKRRNVLRALLRLQRGLYVGKYRQDLLRIARGMPVDTNPF